MGKKTYTSATAATDYAHYINLHDVGAVSTVTDSLYGQYMSLMRDSAQAGATVNLYGQYINLTGDTEGTSTAYGSYVDSNTAADTQFGYYSYTTGNSLTGAATAYGYYTSTSMFGTGANKAYGVYSSTGAYSSGNSAYGLYSVTTASNASSTAYGLFVDAGTGSGTEYAGAFLNGNVGIGTSNPSDLLHLAVSNNSSNVLNALRLQRIDGDTVGANGLGTAIDFYLEDAGSNVNQAARLDVVWEDATNASEDASMRFNTMIAGTLTEAMRIDDLGYLGVGSTAPASLFSVGSANQFQINTAGSVVAGTWQGSTIGVAYGGTGTNTQFTQGSLVFAGNSGVYSQDNGNLFWDDSNNFLGIGTTAPGAQLEVFGTGTHMKLSYDATNYVTLKANSSGNLVVSGSNTSESGVKIGAGLAEDAYVLFDGNNTGGTDYYFGVDETDHALKLGTGTAIGSNTSLTMLSNGNIGIGTTAPSSLLVVSESSAVTSFPDSATARGVQIVNTNTTDNNMAELLFRGRDINNVITTGAEIATIFSSHTEGALTGHLVFRTTSSGNINERMRITSSGSVGIGTTNPSGKLQVSGGNLIIDAGRSYSALGTDGTSIYTLMKADDNDNTMVNASSVSGGRNILFASGSSPHSAFDYSGNLGIGTTSPSSLVHVTGNDANNFIARFIHSGNNEDRQGLLVQAGLHDQSTGTNSALLSFRDGDGTGVGSITFRNSQTYFNATSDVRLKENIVDTQLSIQKLMKIQVRDYTWKEDREHKIAHGVIAQELLTVYPDAVSVPKDPNDMMMVDYTKLTPLIVKSVQDQQQQIISQGLELEKLSSQDLTMDEKIAVIGASLSDIDQRLTQQATPGQNMETDIQQLTTTMSDMEQQLTQLSVTVDTINQLSAQFIAQLSDHEQRLQTLEQLVANGSSQGSISGELSYSVAAFEENLMVSVRQDGQYLFTVNGDVQMDVIVAGQVKVANTDEMSKTLGEAVIRPISIDQNNDGHDDMTNSDGKSIRINTQAITIKSRVYITPVGSTGNQVPYVADITEGNGFTIKVDNTVSSEIKLNWWVVQEN